MVLLSDQALLWLVKDPDLCLWMQTYEGWGFVLSRPSFSIWFV